MASPFANSATAAAISTLAIPVILAWIGIVAPAKTPRAVIARLNREVNAILLLPDVKARLDSLGVEPAGGSADEFTRLIETESRRYGDAIRRLGLQPN